MKSCDVRRRTTNVKTVDEEHHRYVSNNKGSKEWNGERKKGRKKGKGGRKRIVVVDMLSSEWRLRRHSAS